MASGLISLVVGAGAQVLSSLFRPKQKDSYTFGPRVSDLNVPTVSPGNEINRVWGTMKVNTQYIWTSRLIETMHVASQPIPGGKGGGGKGGATSYTISYTYAVHTAIGICRGPAAQVNRIWAAGKLLWTNPNQVAFIQAAFDLAFIAEAKRLLDLGVPADQAYVSAYFFAYNTYMNASTLTMWSVNSAVAYIMSHTPIPFDPEDTNFPSGYPAADFWTVYNTVVQLFDPVSWDKKYIPTPLRFDSITIYNGDAFQEPDTTLQAAMGVGAVSGYRDLCYAVINNLQLADFGNTVPQFTAEVMKDGELTYETHTTTAATGLGFGLAGAISQYGAPPSALAPSPSDPFWSATGTTTTQIVARAVAKKVTLVGILNDILTEAGLQPEDYDTTTAIPGDIEFDGYAITQPSATRSILQDLQKIFTFDGCESGYKIKFKMINERPRAIIRRSDFAAHIDTDDQPPSLEQTRASELDLPRRLNFKFQEPDRNYSINTVWAERQTGKSLGVEDMDVTIGISRSLAKKQVEAALAMRFKLRNTYKIFLPRKYIVLEPGDVVLIADKEYSHQWSARRVTEIAIGANGILEVTFCDSDFLENDMPAIVGEDIDIDDPTLPEASRTYAYLLDIPPPSDIIPDAPQFFVVLSGVTAGWKAGGLLVDISNPGDAPAFGALDETPTQGSNWFVVASGSIQVPHGFAIKTLDPTVTPMGWDNKSEVIVYLMNPQITLHNADPVDMLTQALNVAYIGGEIVQFADVQDLGNGKWKLTKFLRGLRGTDYAIKGHFGAEKFVMLSADAIERVVQQETALNKEATYVALSANQPISGEVPFKFTNTGNSLKPLIPYVMNAHWDTATFTLEWQPRNRVNGKWKNDTDIVLDQATEKYEIDVYKTVSGTPVFVKTYSVNASRTWSYSESTILTDLGLGSGPVPSGVHVFLYQIGAVVGRGHPTERINIT